ncbi:tRNA 2'-phosphotransferase 1 [Hyposmocoma kahamanoa]|uniref:tRNA 2'-phosphotransferase 1 n=1 Tax=Hyposmocoma kahamanoa TaxID=1477025 RepID=UPI000E6D81F0|nr:tRNA 2'-phosphotransferase 1 [Hyposmocoma kahamanoa]
MIKVESADLTLCPDCLRSSQDAQLSKALSWLLRHGALKEGFSLSPEGYLPVAQILQHKSFRGYTSLDIERVVSNNNKQRFKLRTHPETKILEIKATQGHSLDVSDSELIPLSEVCFHVL